MYPQGEKQQFCQCYENFGKIINKLTNSLCTCLYSKVYRDSLSKDFAKVIYTTRRYLRIQMREEDSNCVCLLACICLLN